MTRRPLLNVRTDPTVKAALQRIADRQGVTLSDVCRAAFDAYIRADQRRGKGDTT